MRAEDTCHLNRRKLRKRKIMLTKIKVQIVGNREKGGRKGTWPPNPIELNYLRRWVTTQPPIKWRQREKKVERTEQTARKQ